MNLLDATIDYERSVRIRQGFDLLDAHGPSDWRPMLEANAEYLDMGDSHGCALGMIYGNYWKDSVGSSVSCATRRTTASTP